ncbi:MAG: hypothetical protein K0S07_1731 [Chlamydiales bacterium]|jgi:phage-related protein|nr:hypothetical protein [Chlamydiales bacterium]
MNQRHSFDHLIDQVESLITLAAKCQESTKVNPDVNLDGIEKELKEIQQFMGKLKEVNQKTIESLGYKNFADFLNKKGDFRTGVQKTLNRIELLSKEAQLMQQKIGVQLAQRAVGQATGDENLSQEQLQRKAAKKRQRKFDRLDAQKGWLPL